VRAGLLGETHRVPTVSPVRSPRSAGHPLGRQAPPEAAGLQHDDLSRWPSRVEQGRRNPGGLSRPGGARSRPRPARAATPRSPTKAGRWQGGKRGPTHQGRSARLPSFRLKSKPPTTSPNVGIGRRQVRHLCGSPPSGRASQRKIRGVQSLIHSILKVRLTGVRLVGSARSFCVAEPNSENSIHDSQAPLSTICTTPSSAYVSSAVAATGRLQSCADSASSGRYRQPRRCGHAQAGRRGAEAVAIVVVVLVGLAVTAISRPRTQRATS